MAIIDSNFPTFKSLLDAKQPLILTLHVTSDFEYPLSRGFVKYAPGASFTGGQTVEVVGYINNASLPTGAPTGSGGGYLIIKNSWGCYWGDAGYAFLPYDYVKYYGIDMITVTPGSV